MAAARRKRKHAWTDVPREPAPVEGTEDLLKVWEQIDVGKRRVEVLEGRLVVSPVAVIWHERVCRWLDHSFYDACDENGWFADRGGELYLPRTGELIEPDFLVLADSETLPVLEHQRPLDRVLLTGEVISGSSVRDDREVKPKACALAGIPLYLLVDRFTKPVTISLHSDPGDNGYAMVDTVIAGEKLQLPDPFGLALDTSSLPLPA
jgi:Uma2 family endonuclease